MYIHFTLKSDDGLNLHVTEETLIGKREQLQSFILYLFLWALILLLLKIKEIRYL